MMFLVVLLYIHPSDLTACDHVGRALDVELAADCKPYLIPQAYLLDLSHLSHQTSRSADSLLIRMIDQQ